MKDWIKWVIGIAGTLIGTAIIATVTTTITNQIAVSELSILLKERTDDVNQIAEKVDDLQDNVEDINRVVNGILFILNREFNGTIELGSETSASGFLQ